jgi:methionyl-tRNA formyltransferase
MATGLRIVYFGTPEFAAYILRTLVQSGEQIVGVVTTPDKPRGRGLRLECSAVSQIATEFGIPILKPVKHRDPGFQQSLRDLDPDIFVVVAYKILPMEVIAIPRLGSFNVHASLLPKYRGAAPINWAMIRGERETGITTFLLEQGVDTGKILLQERTPISPDETAAELHDRLKVLGAHVAIDSLRGIASGSLQPILQSNADATPAPKIFPSDCIIDFNLSAHEIHNFIRGLSPHPGAITTLKDVRLKILRSSFNQWAAPSLNPAKFRIEGNRLWVGTGNGTLEILEIQREGKRAMPVEEFLRGNTGLFH